MYKSLNDTIPALPSFLTTLSHSDLLNHLTNNISTLDSSASTMAPFCPHPSLSTIPPLPIPLAYLQSPFYNSQPPTSLFTFSSAPNHHNHSNEVSSLATTRTTTGEISSAPLIGSSSRKRKVKENAELCEGQIIAGGDPKRYRTTYSPYQSKRLEEVFQNEHYISRPQRAQLAAQLQLPENTIKVNP